MWRGGVGEENFLRRRVRFGEASLGCATELNHVRRVARQHEFAIFQNQCAARADDLETIRAGSFTSGTHEHARGLIRPFEIRGDVVFDFNLVKATELTEAAHARRHSEQPLQHVEIVQALIEQHSAAFAFPGRAPRTAGVVSLAAKPIGVDPVHACDFAEVAVADQRADFFVTRFDAQLKHAAKRELGIFLMRGDELFRVGFVSGDGFLDHQVQSRLERRDAERRVLIMRRGDDDRVHRL